MKVLYFEDNSLCYTLHENNLQDTEIICLNDNQFSNFKNNKIKDRVFNFFPLFEEDLTQVTLGRWISTYAMYDKVETPFKEMLGGEKNVVFIIGLDEYRSDMVINLHPFKTIADWAIEQGANVHLLLTFHENFTDDNYKAVLRLLPDVNKYATIALYNLTDEASRAKKFWQNMIIKDNSKEYVERYHRMQAACYETAREFSSILRKIPNDSVCDGITYLYNHRKKHYEAYIFDEDDLAGANADPIASIIEEIAPHDGKSMCNRLRTLRDMYAKKYSFKHEESECNHEGACSGTCRQCDAYAKDLYFAIRKRLMASQKLKNTKRGSALNGTEKDVKLPVCCISRLRDGSDGNGIRTLIITHKCPLRCKYCINKEALKKFPASHQLGVDELFNKVSCDLLYYKMTGGGITFGGGEPLLYAEFIRIFARSSMVKLNIIVETSLNVPQENVAMLTSVVNDWIIDIKDMNPQIYSDYTGKTNDNVISNLQYLLQHFSAEHIHIRVPRIPEFNTDLDINNSVNALKKMGIKHISVFDYVVKG